MKFNVFLMSLVQSVFGYNPVLLIHGVLSEARYLRDLKNMIESEHPGTEVYLVSLYPELESFVPLQIQLKYWRAKIEPVMKNATEGVNLICHSQGGLICQGLIETIEDHNVHSFVALSSPINGQFGVPSIIVSYIPWLKGSRESLSKYMYARFTQSTFAISNYWRDPRKEYQEEYRNNCRYLPVMQNNPKVKKLDHQKAVQREKNFLRLKKLILIGGPDDGVIIPWQSSLFGYYDANYTIVPMKEQNMFMEDWFGLQTLYNRGDVHAYIFPGVKHTKWHGNENVFRKAMLPWLN